MPREFVMSFVSIAECLKGKSFLYDTQIFAQLNTSNNDDH